MGALKLECLRDSFGKSEEQDTHERFRKRLIKQAESCKASRSGLEDKLLQWKTEIEAFDHRVNETQGLFQFNFCFNKVDLGVCGLALMEAGRRGYDQKIGRLQEEKRIQDTSLAEKRNEEAEARRKFESAQARQKELLGNFYIPQGTRFLILNLS